MEQTIFIQIVCPGRQLGGETVINAVRIRDDVQGKINGEALLALPLGRIKPRKDEMLGHS